MFKGMLGSFIYFCKGYNLYRNFVFDCKKKQKKQGKCHLHMQL